MTRTATTGAVPPAPELGTLGAEGAQRLARLRGALDTAVAGRRPPPVSVVRTARGDAQALAELAVLLGSRRASAFLRAADHALAAYADGLRADTLELARAQRLVTRAAEALAR
jgi:hypothetical protein